MNWAGQPLREWPTGVEHLRGTSTTNGLSVQAELLAGDYPTGERVSDEEFARLRLDRHAAHPTWNYTLRPRPTAGAAAVTPTAGRGLVS